MSRINQKIILRYSADNVEKPTVYTLITKYNLMPNIIKANIDPNKEGYLVMEVSGEEEDFKRGIDYLKSEYMEVAPFAESIAWDEDSCTHCGACTGVCPTDALSLNRPEMTLNFQRDKCIVCHMCIQACPFQAVRLDF